nr:MAG TPA: hypothetical protein [Caudoviricetes sp.]
MCASGCTKNKQRPPFRRSGRRNGGLYEQYCR